MLSQQLPGRAKENKTIKESLFASLDFNLDSSKNKAEWWLLNREVRWLATSKNTFALTNWRRDKGNYNPINFDPA